MFTAKDLQQLKRVWESLERYIANQYTTIWLEVFEPNKDYKLEGVIDIKDALNKLRKYNVLFE